MAAATAAEYTPRGLAAVAAAEQAAAAATRVQAAERAAAAATAALNNREAHLRARERTRAAVMAAMAAATASERRTLLAARKLDSLTDAQTPLPGDSRLNDEGFAVEWAANARDGRRIALQRTEDDLAAIEVWCCVHVCACLCGGGGRNDVCSRMKVQRIVRGVQGMKYASARRRAYTAATRTLQRIARGFVGRRRAARSRSQRDAALRIQTNARGATARARVSRMRAALQAKVAATAVQAMLRMIAGTARVRTRRTLLAASAEAVRAASGLTGRDLADLAGYDDAPDFVAELVRCVLILIAPMPVSATEVNSILVDLNAEAPGRFSFITAAKRNGDCVFVFCVRVCVCVCVCGSCVRAFMCVRLCVCLLACVLAWRHAIVSCRTGALLQTLWSPNSRGERELLLIAAAQQWTELQVRVMCDVWSVCVAQLTCAHVCVCVDVFWGARCATDTAKDCKLQCHWSSYYSRASSRGCARSHAKSCTDAGWGYGPSSWRSRCSCYHVRCVDLGVLVYALTLFWRPQVLGSRNCRVFAPGSRIFTSECSAYYFGAHVH